MFDEANARFAFTPLPVPGGDHPWEGMVNEGGWLRLVASGPGVFKVAILELDPTDEPSTAKVEVLEQ